MRRLCRSQQGATAIEYAILAGIIGLGLVGSLVATRGSLSSVFGTASSQMGSSDAGGSGSAPVSSSARAPYWNAKTASGSPIVATQGNWRQTVYNYTDGSQVAYFTNAGATPPTRTVSVLSPDRLSLTTTTVNANGVQQWQEVQYFRSPISGFNGFTGLSQGDPSGSTPNGTTQAPLLLQTGSALQMDRFTYWGNFGGPGGAPTNYTEDYYNTSGTWTGKTTVTANQAWQDGNAVSLQDLGYFGDITK